jgi:Pentapeptide repeats (8 copies)
MSPELVAAIIAASVSLLTLIGSVATQIYGIRKTSNDTEKTLKDQREQLDKTLKEQSKQLDKTIAEQREGQVTDRYAKAVEQLGSDTLDVRIGGIYALERIARDSAEDHPTVMEVLAAFIRIHSDEQWPPGRESERWTRPDVQVAVTVIGRRDVQGDIQGRPIDLYGANLTSAQLRDANLRGAVLRYAKLTGARLHGTILVDADLRDVDLRGAAHLDEADLTGAKWSADAPVPEGWKLDTSSGRLVAAGTD